MALVHPALFGFVEREAPRLVRASCHGEPELAQGSLRAEDELLSAREAEGQPAAPALAFDDIGIHRFQRGFDPLERGVHLFTKIGFVHARFLQCRRLRCQS